MQIIELGTISILSFVLKMVYLLQISSLVCVKILKNLYLDLGERFKFDLIIKIFDHGGVADYVSHFGMALINYSKFTCT